MKKSTTEMTEKELLDLVSKDSDIILYNWPNDVMEFISVYNIKSGKEEIASKLLYKLYKLWSKQPVKKRTFAMTFTDLFPSINSIDGTKYNLILLLDKKAINLKQEAYNFIKKNDKTKEKGWMEHFEKYLYFFSIKSGSLFIKDSVLYKLYSRWYGKKRRPLGFDQFNNYCKLYFKNKLIKTNYWFAVDKYIKNHLDEELIKEMSTRSAVKKENKTV